MRTLAIVLVALAVVAIRVMWHRRRDPDVEQGIPSEETAQLRFIRTRYGCDRQVAERIRECYLSWIYTANFIVHVEPWNQLEDELMRLDQCAANEGYFPGDAGR